MADPMRRLWLILALLPLAAPARQAAAAHLRCRRACCRTWKMADPIRRLWLILALLPLAAPAQQAATLLSDRLTIAEGPQLAAEGHVEVFFDGTRLTATAITYDRSTDRLTITGPILIQTADGTILTAQAATLDPALRNGLLIGARLVLDRQLQLAANRIDRVDGNLTQLVRAAATACQVCGTGAPLWEIRAARIIHDAEAQQLYFEDAVLRVAGLPILWLPRMRLPDPTLDRASGLLVPGIRTTDRLGPGLRLPYFFALGDHRDLTLTPYLSPRTRTIEARWRQAFLTGDIEVNAAVTQDSLLPDATRGYVLADGAFALGHGLRLSFGIQAVSDPAYLVDYGHGDLNRLESGLHLTRVLSDRLLIADLTAYQSLRADEGLDSLPPLVAGFQSERRYFPGLGGVLTLSAGAEAFARTSPATGDPGRDVARVGLGLDWQRDWVLGPGVLVQARGALFADHYVIGDDPAFAAAITRLTPAAMLTLRWPLVRHGSGGAVDVVEPALSLAYMQVIGADVPAEDSGLAEFDEGNLFALGRSPGQDGRATGTTLATGLNWTHIAPGGWETRLTFGRVLADNASAGFAASSGLAGLTSDWLVSGQLRLPQGLALTARTLIGQAGVVGKTDARLDWQADRVQLSAAYVWLPADPGEDRAAPISEWSLDAAYVISDRWSIRLDGRYDVASDEPAQAGLGLGWRNDCLAVDLSVSRSYTDTSTLDPTTDFNLSVTLNGFSSGRAATTTRGGCRG